jgi:hypothetical protein
MMWEASVSIFPVDHEWSILTPISLRVVYSDVNNQGLSFTLVRMEAKRI